MKVIISAGVALLFLFNVGVLKAECTDSSVDKNGNIHEYLQAKKVECPKVKVNESCPDKKGSHPVIKSNGDCSQKQLQGDLTVVEETKSTKCETKTAECKKHSEPCKQLRGDLTAVEETKSTKCEPKTTECKKHSEPCKQQTTSKCGTTTKHGTPCSTASFSSSKSSSGSSKTSSCDNKTTTPVASQICGSVMPLTNKFSTPALAGDANDLKISVDQATSKQFEFNYKPTGTNGYAGFTWSSGKELNMQGATSLTFCAKGNGTINEFSVGGTGSNDSSKTSLTNTTLTSDWKTYTIDLTGKDLSKIADGFGFSASKADNPAGFTMDIKNIQFDFAKK